MPSVFEVWSVHEAAEIVARAAEAGERVSVDGPGGDVVLSTRRLDQVLEHEAGDLTATVEAGVRIDDLNARLAEHGQMLVLDPPGNPTLGACISGNLSGPRRHRYGTARDLVLGVTVVLGDGTVASSGGKVVKNVAGYDLGKLLCGSEGRLGFIARASLRLHPRPESARTLAVAVDEPAEAERLTRALLSSQLVPSAVDLLWPGWLAVLFEGSARAVEAQMAAARALLGGHEDEAIWPEIEARQEWSRGLRRFDPGRLAEALSGMGEALVRVAAGLAYVGEPVPDTRDEPLRELTERLRVEFDPAGVFA